MHQGRPWRRANQARLKELRVRLRRYHARTDTPAQTIVAPPITSHVLWSRIVSWITNANAKSPMLPIAVPAASTETSCLARPWPFSPARSFFSFSCLSINVALAGKMAGNARKRPPTAGSVFVPYDAGECSNQSAEQKPNREFVPASFLHPRSVHFDQHADSP